MGIIRRGGEGDVERVRGLPAHPRGSKKGMTGELMQVHFNCPSFYAVKCR